MNRQSAFKVALASAGSLCLSGCVVAAVPLVAGGALVRTQTDREVPARAVPQPQAPQFAELTGAEAQLATGEAFIGEAPPPDAFSGQSRRIWGFERMTDYALPRMGTREIGATRVSAMLADPTSLSPERKNCSGLTPTILIDLDPAGALFKAETMAMPSQRDIAALASWREKGGFVAWISGSSAIAAGDIRAKLIETGLDPEGKDELLLLRYPGERKQSRREAIAASSCLLAIAGDERSDFDELFDYLANPEAALGLELLIDDGWFLIPAFTPITPDTIAANKEAQP